MATTETQMQAQRELPARRDVRLTDIHGKVIHDILA